MTTAAPSSDWVAHMQQTAAAAYRRPHAAEIDPVRDEYLQQLAEEYYNLNKESITMTTTQLNTTPRPPLPATVPPSVSPGVLAVENLQKKMDDRLFQINHTIEVLEANRYKQIAQIEGEIGILRGMVEGLCDLLQKQPPAQPATLQQQPDAHGNGCVVFHVDDLTMTYDDKGKPAYKAKGGRYAKFGVRVWPEVLPLLGIDAATLKPGPNAVDLMVRAELAETTDKDTGEKSMNARKVIGLA